MRNLTVFRPWAARAWPSQFNDVNPALSRDSFWNDIEEFFEGARNQTASFEPHADVEETETAYKISLDLPGVKEADVDLKLEDKHLTLRAKREEKSEEKGTNSLRKERFYGEYTRSFRLPQNADGSKIEAEMKNGVLEVTIPKSAETQPKSIPIKLS